MRIEYHSRTARKHRQSRTDDAMQIDAPPLSVPPFARHGTRKAALMQRLLVLALVGASIAVAAVAAARDATLLWTAPGDDGTLGRATRYECRMKTVAIAGTDTTGWWSAAGGVTVPAPSVAGASDSARVTGLQPTTTYFFLIVAFDDAGNRSPWSNLAVLGPLDVVGPGPIQLRVEPR